MATFKSFKDFGSAFDAMTKAIEQDRKVWALEMAKRAEAIATQVASSDLGGDPKFSGWKPELSTKTKTIPTGAVFSPTKSGAGPWTVAEFGRHHGSGGGFAGPGVNRKTGATSRTKSGGLRKVRAVSGKRWNGYTDPKHTASKALARMEHELYPIAEKGLTRTQMRHFDID